MAHPRAARVQRISRAELRQLSVEVPADQKVINLFDANVRQWSVEKSGSVQKIAIALFEPARSSQQVNIELERLSSGQGGRDAADSGDQSPRRRASRGRGGW